MKCLAESVLAFILAPHRNSDATAYQFNKTFNVLTPLESNCLREVSVSVCKNYVGSQHRSCDI